MFGEVNIRKTGIYQEVVNLNEAFNGLTFTPLIANRFDISTDEGKEALNNQIYTRCDGDSLNVTPHCECHYLEGGKECGVVCPVCKTVCEPPTDKPLVSLLWVEVPKEIPAFVNPAIWTILSEKLKTNKFSLLEWICNPLYNPDSKRPDVLTKLELAMDISQIPRGMKSFYENFDRIMQLLYDLRVFQAHMRKQIEQLIAENREKVFCQYLPVPSKISFVIESNQDTGYYDKNIPDAINAVRTIVSIDQGARPVKGNRRDARVVDAMTMLSNYYQGFFGDIFGGKFGLARQHVFGSRTAFTARAVITNIVGVCRYDSLILPWALSLQLFRLHLFNKLWCKPYNMNPVQIDRLLKESAYKYSPLIHKVLNELIAESPLGRIPVVFQRNPSLRPGSGQLLYVDGFKTDPLVTSISLAHPVLPAPNAD